MRLGLSLFLALAVTGTAAAAEDRNAPVVLEPASYWSVDFGEEKCRLARAYGDAEDRHLLFIEQGGPSARFGLILVGDAFDRFRRPDRISVQFGEFAPVETYRPMLGDTEGVGASLIYSSMRFFVQQQADDDASLQSAAAALPRLDVEDASTIASITVRQGKRRVVFNTADLGDAIKVLNECSLNFVESWGLDRAAHETMTRLPRWTNKDTIIRRIQSVYPSDALRKGEQGIFRIRVIVEADGSISECVINNATITESLESPACQNMTEARFEPAMDQNGEPMRSFYLNNITYRASVRR